MAPSSVSCVADTCWSCDIAESSDDNYYAILLLWWYLLDRLLLLCIFYG